MISDYKGHYAYNAKSVKELNSKVKGVYYIGFVNENKKLNVVYVGKGVSDEGIRGRILDHLTQDNWKDANAFGYRTCTTKKEAGDLESNEIARLQPKYNKQGK